MRSSPDEMSTFLRRLVGVLSGTSAAATSARPAGDPGGSGRQTPQSRERADDATPRVAAGMNRMINGDGVSGHDDAHDYEDVEEVDGRARASLGISSPRLFVQRACAAPSCQAVFDPAHSIDRIFCSFECRDVGAPAAAEDIAVTVRAMRTRLLRLKEVCVCARVCVSACGRGTCARRTRVVCTLHPSGTCTIPIRPRLCSTPTAGSLARMLCRTAATR